MSNGPVYAKPRPTGGIELYAWLFMRLSGVILLVLALGHLFIMHVFNNIHEIDYNFVVSRYLHLFWRVYDLAMLWLALIHGLNGLRTILDDYLKPPFRRMAVQGIYILAIFFLIVGTWVILTFQPVTGKMG